MDIYLKVVSEKLYLFLHDVSAGGLFSYLLCPLLTSGTQIVTKLVPCSVLSSGRHWDQFISVCGGMGSVLSIFILLLMLY